MQATNAKRPDVSFLLYAAGTSVWLCFTTFSGSSSTAALSASEGLPLQIARAACFSLSFFVIVLADRRGLVHRWTMVGAAIGLLTAALALQACSSLGDAGWLHYASALFLAAGCSCGFCQWLRILSQQSYERAQRYLALGSLALIAMMFLFLGLSVRVRTVLTYGVFAPISVALMVLNVHTNGNVSPAIDKKAARGGNSLEDNILLPVMCAMALSLITPIASTTLDPSSSPIVSGAIQPLAHATALAILSVVWFVARRDITLLQFYGIFLPVFASLFFLMPAMKGGQAWAVVFVGDASFFFVSLLMVTASLKISAARGLSAVTLYGIFAGCVYATNALQLVLEFLTEQGLLSLGSYAAALLLLYVMVIPAFFVVLALVPRRSKKASKERTGAESSAQEVRVESATDAPCAEKQPRSDTERACERVAKRYGLPARQAELLTYFALGRDVPYIAEALHLSPNTVRSYCKDLYTALDVHSRQELIDLVEAERLRTLERVGEEDSA